MATEGNEIRLRSALQIEPEHNGELGGSKGGKDQASVIRLDHQEIVGKI